MLHTDLDPAALEEVKLDVDLCTVDQLKVLNWLHGSYRSFSSLNPHQVSYTMAGRRGGRTKMVRRLQVAARYPGISLLWVFGYLGIIHLGFKHKTLVLACFGCPGTWELGSTEYPGFGVLYVPGFWGFFLRCAASTVCSIVFNSQLPCRLGVLDQSLSKMLGIFEISHQLDNLIR